MAIPTFGMRWRQNLVPASFRGAGFKVEADAKASGRRVVGFEFPKNDQGYTEDLGRRLRHYHVLGYIVSSPALEPDYQGTRDTLIAALEAPGAGLLVHPTLGTDTVMCERYSVSENKQKGGACFFEMEFVEAGTKIAATPNTKAAVTSAAQAALAALQQSAKSLSP